MTDEELDEAILRLLHERRRENQHDRVVATERLTQRVEQPVERVRERLKAMSMEDPPRVKESGALPDRWFLPD